MARDEFAVLGNGRGKKMKLSIYDLDKALCEKDTFRFFSLFLLKHGFISFKGILSIILKYLLYILGLSDLKFVKETVLSSLKRKNKTEIRNITRRFLNELDGKFFRAELLKNIESEKAKGIF